MSRPILSIGSILLVLTADPGNAAELTKGEAAAIVAWGGCQNAQVAAVVHGVGVIGSARFPISTTSSAVAFIHCMRDNKPHIEEQFFFYDSELGWFMYQIDKQVPRIRMWTKSGYKEIKAKPN